MQYNLIALDLDGTALDPTNQVAPATVAAIAKARQRGMRVVISTGRICGEASEFARQMGADDYMVTSGGAAVSMWGEERCLMRLSMPWEASVRAAAALERVGLSTMVYVGERILITPYDEIMFGKYKSNEGYLAIKKVVPSVAEWVAQNRVMVDKIFSRSADPATIARVRQVLSQIEGIRVMSSASDNVRSYPRPPTRAPPLGFCAGCMAPTSADARPWVTAKTIWKCCLPSACPSPWAMPGTMSRRCAAMSRAIMHTTASRRPLNGCSSNKKGREQSLPFSLAVVVTTQFLHLALFCLTIGKCVFQVFEELPNVDSFPRPGDAPFLFCI